MDISMNEILHKEFHWKNGERYLLEYFKTQTGVKSRMTKAGFIDDKKTNDGERA